MSSELNKKVSISETFKTAFQIWKDNFVLIALVITLVFIPVQIIIEIVSQILVNMNDTNNLESIDDWRRLSNEARIYDFIRELIGVVATLGIFNFIYSIIKLEEDKRGVMDIIKYGMKKWPKNFVENFVAGLITLLFTLLLIIPGIYKAVQYSFISNLVADEESNPMDKSIQLVKGNWFDIFWMLILIFLLGAVIELVVAAPFVLFADNFVVTFVMGILVAVASSYTIVVKAVYYYKFKEMKLLAIQENSIVEAE